MPIPKVVTGEPSGTSCTTTPTSTEASRVSWWVCGFKRTNTGACGSPRPRMMAQGRTLPSVRLSLSASPRCPPSSAAAVHVRSHVHRNRQTPTGRDCSPHCDLPSGASPSRPARLRKPRRTSAPLWLSSKHPGRTLPFEGYQGFPVAGTRWARPGRAWPASTARERTAAAQQAPATREGPPHLRRPPPPACPAHPFSLSAPSSPLPRSFSSTAHSLLTPSLPRPGLGRRRLVNHRHVGPGCAEAGCASAALALRALVENSRRPTGAARRRPRPPSLPSSLPPCPRLPAAARPRHCRGSFLPREPRCASPAPAAPGLAPPAPLALGLAALTSFAPLLGAPSRGAALPPTLCVAGWHPEKPGAASWRLRLRRWGAASPLSPATPDPHDTPSPHLGWSERQREKPVPMGVLSSTQRTASSLKQSTYSARFLLTPT
ncbi:uncharacterized protein LOC113592935 [Acinonyx jubatus]|uniref:Uncharacterized protein LOC113592935 n=1 Tax=Acinonyx jubatus TaxID=32536 RepID=A0A6J1XFU5_ACIJB|nr:uncharacterized protein LOC113592935 [Acinonyx jubatus]XP_053082124.1 uncharacterized protein LOC113592935 [Acinonyx jubatus]XP_053082125.1 uncharacterized protein LOC113592935 [Acinonyx jubatus]